MDNHRNRYDYLQSCAGEETEKWTPGTTTSSRMIAGVDIFTDIGTDDRHDDESPRWDDPKSCDHADDRSSCPPCRATILLRRHTGDDIVRELQEYSDDSPDDDRPSIDDSWCSILCIDDEEDTDIAEYRPREERKHHSEESDDQEDEADDGEEHGIIKH